MSKIVKIPNIKKSTSNKRIVEYTKPQVIYIPLESKNGVKYTHLVKEGDYVYKGSVIAINKSINFPIHSSVSGYVVSGSKKIINNGNKIKCIVIENDFKEKYEDRRGYKKDISNYSKEEFLEMLRTHGITGLGGSDFPTFIKYKICDNYKCLLVNGVECEPFVTADYALMKEKTDEILESIDAILEIMNIKEAYIAINEEYTDVINIFNKHLGTYPNIKLSLVRNGYPNGWERNTIDEVFGLKYKKYPTEIGILVSNVSTIYAIYEMLKYNRPLTERVITITGPSIKTPSNVKVKIGASINEMIDNIGGYKKLNKPLLIAGGPMMGTSIPTDELIVTKDLNCVIVMEDNFAKPTECISCGKCASVCPANLIPILIKQNINDISTLKKLKCTECIECGLCSYICPAKIELREYVKEAKNKLRTEAK